MRKYSRWVAWLSVVISVTILAIIGMLTDYESTTSIIDLSFGAGLGLFLDWFNNRS